MADIVYSGQQAGGALNSDALPANYDLVIYKGDYVRLLVSVTDSELEAMDLTGAVPEAVLKSDYSDQSPIPLQCTITSNPGEVEVFLSSADSSSLIPGSYIWDFQITFAGGNTRTFLAGDVTVYNEVTT